MRRPAARMVTGRLGWEGKRGSLFQKYILERTKERPPPDGGGRFLAKTAVSAHEAGEFFHALDGESGRGQRPHGDGHELHRIIVCGGGKGAAPAASVDDGPLAALAYPHCDRLHHPAAVCGTVPRLCVYMEAGEAVGTMVAVAAPCALRRHGAAAGAAGESVMTGMGLVIAWLEGPFLLSRSMIVSS